MTANYETLLVETDGPIRTITFNRPEVLNAISGQTFDELADVLHRTAPAPEIRVLVLRGAGRRAFIAGADIRGMTDMDAEDAVARSRHGMAVYDRMRRMPQPLIASVHGYALGGGMLMALACDLRIAGQSAQFGYPEIKLGIFPGTGGTVLLDRMIGAAAARALCLTGERFSADRAYQLGIVTKVVPDEALAAATLETARLLAGYSPVAVRELKSVLNASLEMDFETAREIELTAYGTTFDSEDRREGTRAFVEKRAPRFQGR